MMKAYVEGKYRLNRLESRSGRFEKVKNVFVPVVNVKRFDGVQHVPSKLLHLIIIIIIIIIIVDKVFYA